MEESFLVVREAVEAGGDDPLQRLGERQVVVRAALEVELGELLGVERIAVRALEQPLLDLGREHRALEHARDQDGCLFLRERREAERRGVQLAAAPTGPTLEQLWSRSTDDEQWNSAQPLDELVDEVEQAVVGPVEILEYEYERAPFGEGFEEPAPGRERLTAAVAPGAGLGLEADQRTEVGLDPRRVRRLTENVPDRGLELLGGLGLVIALEDPGLRLHHLAQRPEGDPVAVREATPLAPGDDLGVVVDDAREFVDEPALAHSGDTDQRHELRDSFVPRSVERVAQDRELTLSSDELGTRLMGDVHTETGPCCHCLPHGDRLGLALRFDRRCVSILDGLAGRTIGRLIREDPVDGSGALQACGRVHDVAGGHSLAFERPRVERDEGLTGRNARLAARGSPPRRNPGSRVRHERLVRDRPRVRRVRRRAPSRRRR